MRKPAWILWLALSVQAVAQLPPAAHLSLAEAQSMAVQSHPALLRARAEIMVARARVDRVASAWEPQLSAEAVLKEGPPGAPNFRFPGLVNSGNLQNAGVDLVLTQTMDFGRTRHRFEARERAAESARWREQEELARLLLAVYTSYSHLLRDRDLVALGLDREKTWQETLRQSEGHFHKGLVSRVDVRLAQANLAQARGAQAMLRGNLRKSQAELQSLLGLTLTPACSLDPLPAPSAPLSQIQSQEKDVDIAIEQRPEVKSLDEELASATASIEAAQAQANPYVTLYATVGAQTARTPIQDPNNYAVGLGFSWPLFTGGSVQADVAEAQHLLEVMQARRHELVLNIRQQVENGAADLQSLQELAASLEVQAQAAEDAFALAKARYRYGLGSLAELEQAERHWLEAREQSTVNQYSRLEAQEKYLYLMGMNRSSQ